MLPGRAEVPKWPFAWICGQISGGRKEKWQEKKEMTGDGAREWISEKTDFWAVATPLLAAFTRPTPCGAGGRYRPTCSPDLLAPSLANLRRNQLQSLTTNQRRSKRWL